MQLKKYFPYFIHLYRNDTGLAMRLVKTLGVAMTKSFYTAILLMLSGQAAMAACFNYIERPDVVAPIALICISGNCSETAMTHECGNASGMQIGYDNGLSTECVAENGSSSCSLFSNGTPVSWNSVACSNLSEDPACGPLPSPCDAHMDTIERGFRAAPDHSRKDAQYVLQELGYYMNFDNFPAQPAAIDGLWGTRTQAAFSRFCANDLSSIGLQRPGQLNEREAYELVRYFGDLLEVLGDNEDMPSD